MIKFDIKLNISHNTK